MGIKGTILVVEDDPDSRTALCTILEAHGCNVIAFASGMEAIEGLKSEPEIDLAMLDIMMPEINGYELLKEIRRVDAYVSIPIIMVTAKDNDSEILDGYKIGADYYITKPYTSQQIEYALKLYLS